MAYVEPFDDKKPKVTYNINYDYESLLGQPCKIVDLKIHGLINILLCVHKCSNDADLEFQSWYLFKKLY